MKRIILIDDNACFNKISKLTLSRLIQNTDIEIVGFTEPKEGLSYILSEYEQSPVKTAIFLDINMPVLNGWAVLDVLNRLPDSIKNYLTVFMLSSSIDPHDKLKALSHSIVKAYLEKPLSNHLKIVSDNLLYHKASV